MREESVLLPSHLIFIKENQYVQICQRLDERKKFTTKIFAIHRKSHAAFFLACAIISILTTFGIVFTLAKETVTFFDEVPIPGIPDRKRVSFLQKRSQFWDFAAISGTFLIAGGTCFVAG